MVYLFSDFKYHNVFLWTRIIFLYGQKEIRFQKYSDTCGFNFKEICCKFIISSGGGGSLSIIFRGLLHNQSILTLYLANIDFLDKKISYLAFTSIMTQISNF